jgi:ABC-type multidrug transport system ATPase subunit
MNKLEVDSITLEFGEKRVLSDIYMKFETGSVTGIFGRNGSGKSCLLRIIFGTLKAQYSNVRYNGRAVFEPFRYPEKIRYMPQDSFIPKYLKLKTIPALFGCDTKALENDFPEYASERNKPFGYLSFGQKRLFETYIILKSASEFVLLDEPFSYVMPVHMDKLKTIIKLEKTTKGIIITDHL